MDMRVESALPDILGELKLYSELSLKTNGKHCTIPSH